MFKTLIALILLNSFAYAETSFTVGTDPIIDITSTGTGLSLGDDNMSGMKPLGFDFDFYGSTFDEVNISMNGFFTFQDNFSVPRNRNYLSEVIPATSFNYTVFPLWSDFIRRTSGNKSPYIQTFGQTSDTDQYFVVMWDNVSEYSNQLKSTFQAILYEGTNAIEFRYDKIQIKTHDITIGVQGNNEAVTYLRYEDTNNTTYIRTDDWSLTTAEVIDESYDNLTSECLIDATFSTLCDVYDLTYEDNYTNEEDYLMGSGVTNTLLYGYDTEEEFYGYNEEDEHLYGGTVSFETNRYWGDTGDYHDGTINDDDIYSSETYYIEEDIGYDDFEFIDDYSDEQEEYETLEFYSFDEIEEFEIVNDFEEPEHFEEHEEFVSFIDTEEEEYEEFYFEENEPIYTHDTIQERREEDFLSFMEEQEEETFEEAFEEEFEEEEFEEYAEIEEEEITEEESTEELVEAEEKEEKENKPRRNTIINSIIESTNNLIDNITSNITRNSVSTQTFSSDTSSPSSSTNTSAPAVATSSAVIASSPISVSNSPSISDQIASSQIQTNTVLQSIVVMPMPSIDNTPSVVMAEVQITRIENQIQSAVSTVVTASEADQISATMGGAQEAGPVGNTVVTSSESDQIAETIIASNIRSQQEQSQQQEQESGEYDTQGQSTLLAYMNFLPGFDTYKEMNIPQPEQWYLPRAIYTDVTIDDNYVGYGVMMGNNINKLSGMVSEQPMELFGG